MVLQSLIMCRDALPNTPASAYTYSLHSSVEKKITLCGDLSLTLDKSRLFNHDYSQGRIVAPPRNLNKYLSLEACFLINAFDGVTGK